ncbi:hypothetical protein [Amycolatopsis australiensis]|uniref:hypothetical protein n=1 Tax=Amycolatopsis australiensis TaxID=546364 RepID=UPI001C42F52B|nr:hypothetical protein [Amycolatopsis australiensis]
MFHGNDDRELAARTAAAHTGALVGDDGTIDAVFRDLGVIRIDAIEDMLVTAGTAAHLGQLARPGFGVVSISGGPATSLPTAPRTWAPSCHVYADRSAKPRPGTVVGHQASHVIQWTRLIRRSG